MIRVKVCGITNPGDALAAVEAGAHALGFVFYPGSKRYVQPRDARSIIAELPPFVSTVGVFVNPGLEEIEEVVRESGVGTVQLHGDESPEFVSRVPLPVIKAIRVGAELDPRQVELYPVQAILFDKRADDMYGGTGRSFDWTLLQGLETGKRIILSGGLTVDNVSEAIRTVRPYAVDVSSGVEDAPGKKNRTKLKQFMEAVRNVI